MKKINGTEEIVLGGGCFWCMEAIYLKIKGVLSVTPGYAGGIEGRNEPTYEEVCSGRTGHAEVVRIVFDKSIISLKEILNLFFLMHDPTTPNSQGNDIGTQYRSIILFRDDAQKEEAEKIMKEIEDSEIYEKKLVTEISKLKEFHEAEDYHKNYYEKNPEKAYCQFVISPKVSKLRSKFHHLMKST